MRNKIENNNDEIMDTTRPLVESLYRSLELGIVNQKEENNNFQEQITDLKKEKSVLSQMIAATLKKTKELSNDVGQYWFNCSVLILKFIPSPSNKIISSHIWLCCSRIIFKSCKKYQNQIYLTKRSNVHIHMDSLFFIKGKKMIFDFNVYFYEIIKS